MSERSSVDLDRELQNGWYVGLWSYECSVRSIVGVFSMSLRTGDGVSEGCEGCGGSRIVVGSGVLTWVVEPRLEGRTSWVT